MKSLSAILAVFSLLLFAKTIESRGGAGIDWEAIRKEQPNLPGLLVVASDSTPKEKADCHENVKKPFVEIEVEVEEFEPRPNISSYHDDESKEEYSAKESDPQPQAKASFVARQDKKPFKDDFEPRPNISVYND